MLLVVLVAFGAALLTLFSGFGLGTLLLPAFLVAFPPEIAVAATAVVHLANNLFKLVLLGRHADRGVVMRFAIPAIVASVLGALALNSLAHLAPLHTWSLQGIEHKVTPIGLTIGVLMILFALFELHPRADKLAFPRSVLPLGGVLSGFLGGLSGHQGALRAAFLVKLGLGREAFLATGVVCAVCVDIARLLVYGTIQLRAHLAAVADSGPQVLAGILAAFGGSYFGSKLVAKVTMKGIQRVVGVMLVLIGAAMAAGFV